MAPTPSTKVRWTVAAFSVANPTAVTTVSGVSSHMFRARSAAADAALAVFFELHEGVLLVSMTVGFTNTVAAIEPTGLDLTDYQPLIDGLLEVHRPQRTWPFKW